MGLIDSWRGSRDLAVDLGTANTVVFARGQGIVVFEPSVIAIDERTEAIHAVGSEAKRMIGRTPATIRAIRPLRHGVIADFDVTEQMLRHFIKLASDSRFSFARVILCVPSGITGIERSAVEEATLGAGARTVYLIEEPIAAAIGAELPIAEAAASMIVDIGGGTTEVAVIALGGMVVWQSIRVGGYEMDDAIVRHVRGTHNIQIGQQTAEDAKIEIGSAWELPEELETDVAGRDTLTGLLRRVRVTSEELRRAVEPPVAQIFTAVKEVLERTPPELAADIAERGITLAGGGSLLRGIDERLRAETHLPVQRVDEPLTCVALGAGRALEEVETLARVPKTHPLRRLRRRSRS
ncbi:MAG: rod shape-determining protein [Gaiellaceae bacterium]